MSRKSLPASYFRGADEPLAAEEPRRAAWKEAVATVALAMLAMRPEMTAMQVGVIVGDAVDGGLAALEAESPGLLSVGGQVMRDRLELLAWRTAAAGGWHVKPARAEGYAK